MINNSKRIVTTDVLALGLNLAVTPKEVPYHNIITATDSTARKLDAAKAMQLRVRVSNALRRAKEI